MKKYLTRLSPMLSFSVILAVLIGLLGTALVATPAQGAETMPSSAQTTTDNEPDSCADVDMTTSNGDCVEVMSSEASSSTTDKSVAAVGTKGKILTRYQVAAGIKLKRSEKRGCPTVSQASKIPRGATCIWGSKGFRFTNSGPDMYGNLVKWSDHVGSPGSSTPGAQKMKFVKRAGQWLKVGTPSGDGNCGNKVWFHGPKPELNWRQVINIKSFANWIFKGNVAVKASALAKAMAKAWCNTAHTSAKAEAEAEAEAEAAASASYKLRGLTKIKQWTNAREAELQQELRLKVDAEAKAKAKAEARAKARAEVKCEETEQPPPPPPANKPPTGEIVQFPAHLYPGGEYRAKVVGSDPEDLGNVTLSYTVSGGASKIVDANHPEICDVEGTQRVCTFWIKAGQASGTNATLTLTVTDSKGRTFTTSKSWPIVADEF